MLNIVVENLQLKQNQILSNFSNKKAVVMLGEKVFKAN